MLQSFDHLPNHIIPPNKRTMDNKVKIAALAAFLCLAGFACADFTRAGPSEGPCTTPVSYYALIINGGNVPGQPADMQTADQIYQMAKAQGYAGVEYLTPRWDNRADTGATGKAAIAEIEQAVDRIRSKVKCVDRVFVFIVGHGIPAYGNAFGREWPSGGILLQGLALADSGRQQINVLTPEELNRMLDKIPACPNEDCKTPGKSCHMQVVIESCHSGNFLDRISGPGRTVVVSAGKDETSAMGMQILGKEGNKVKARVYGSDFTNGYVRDMNDPDSADTDGDGTVSVAEAYASGKAKLFVREKLLKKGKQTPDIRSQECDCLPLTCAPKCDHNGIIDPGEECDSRAAPNGCPQNKPSCSQDCTCYGGITITPMCTGTGQFSSEADCETACILPCTTDAQGCYICPTLQQCPAGTYKYQGECSVKCEAKCVMNDQKCYYCPQAAACPANEYPPADCEARRKPHQLCVNDTSNPGCQYLQSLCQRDSEYVADDCDGACTGSDECIVSDSDVPCYTCGTAPACGSGEYPTASECDGDCSGTCSINEATDCYTCIELGCEAQGMYTSQAVCNLGCHSPDYCAYSESKGCWYCQDVTVTCSGDLYSSSSCDNDCDAGAGETCQLYDDGPCYYCVCNKPDLMVTALSAHISKSTSTHCTGALESSCTTECDMTATAEVKVRNIGKGAAGASTVKMTITPDGSTDTDSVEALAAGATSGTKTLMVVKSATVAGRAEACYGLAWWVDAHTVTAAADSGNAISECNEGNNQNSVTAE